MRKTYCFFWKTKNINSDADDEILKIEVNLLTFQSMLEKFFK